MLVTRLTCMLSVCILLAAGCLGQQSVQKMTNQDVLEMVSLGLSDDVIIDKVHAAGAADFDTSIAGLKALKGAKVSDAVIRAMINPHPAAVSSSLSAGQNGSASANPNDPNSPHDPGIYLYAVAKDGLQMVILEPTVYSQGKSGGMFKSAMTYGIAKMNWKAVVRGAHANVRSSDSKMVFYFYFEESSAGLSHPSFGGTTTPNEFTLLKFEEKKDSRETVVMRANAFGASSGTDEKANTGFAFTKLRPGVYKVVPNEPLKPGEYCFLSSSGVGPYGAGSAGANRLFDFAVLPPE
ncbi:MAG TPA: hypothetical protein VHF01_09170 [Candidatus Acidoferrum sp.]|nr:hypothetical protein [Candidatus Acidoferrum sp.]